jgi:hypothetical protein
MVLIILRIKNNHFVRGNKMKKLVVMLIIAFTLIISSCDKAQTDTRLNGTWKGESGMEKYNNGVVEYSDENNILALQATYTTNNGKVTWTPTHYFGTNLGLNPRWYSEDELRKNFPRIIEPKMFEPETYEYILNDNKLTYTYEDGIKYTLTLVSRDGTFTQAASK